MPLVEQGLPILPEHLQSLSFMCIFCKSWFFLFLFLLAIVLYVLLRLTDSDRPFGAFKLFFVCKLTVTFYF